jgi:SsrA-binding protein
MPRESGEKLIAVNRKARHDYFIEETVEAGIMLLGAEVKSVRDGKVNLKDGYAKITKGGEAYLVGVHISPYGFAARDVPDPERQRKLLLHRREIDRLAGKTRERGFTLVPTKLYFKNGVAKVEIGLARGKEHHDKRQDLKAQESKREIDRVMKSRNRTRS